MHWLFGKVRWEGGRKLRNITFVATKVHFIFLRSFVVFTWMLDQKRIIVACRIMEYHKVQHCNKGNIYNDDSVMHGSVWFALKSRLVMHGR